MHQCTHLSSYKFHHPENILDKLLCIKCDRCKIKENLSISFVNKQILCDHHYIPGHVRLVKDTLLIICIECNAQIPMEKFFTRQNIADLRLKNPKLRTLGCTGLLNLGNTCYINAIMQVLSNLKCIKKYFLNYIAKQEIWGVLKEFCLLLALLWKGEKTHAPKTFIAQIDCELSLNLSRGRHQDTLEFFHLFHHFLDGQMRSQLNNTFISDVVTWKIKHSIRCLTCKNESNLSEELLELPLCIPRNSEINLIREESGGLMRPKDHDDLKFTTSTMWKKLKQ